MNRANLKKLNKVIQINVVLIIPFIHYFIIFLQARKIAQTKKESTILKEMNMLEENVNMPTLNIQNNYI